MVVVDCSSRVGAAAASQLLLSGPDNMQPGTNLAKTSVDLANDILLLSALSSGTLVLNNIHKVRRPCPEFQAKMAQFTETSA